MSRVHAESPIARLSWQATLALTFRLSCARLGVPSDLVSPDIRFAIRSLARSVSHEE